MSKNKIMGIVNGDKIEPSLPPVVNAGLIGWMKENLFNGIFNSLLTIASILLLIWVLPGVLDWNIFSAVWIGDANTCKANSGGACWPLVAYRWEQFLYGQFTFSQRWRIDLGLWWLVTALAFLVFDMRARFNSPLKLALIILVSALSILFIYLMRIHNGSWISVLIGLTLVLIMCWGYWVRKSDAIKNIIGLSLLSIYPILAYFLLHGGSWINLIFIFLNIVLLVAVVYLLLKLIWPNINKRVKEPLSVFVNIFVSIIFAIIVFKFSFMIEDLLQNIFGKKGLSMVNTNRWGGFTLTLVIALTGIVSSLPLGIMLALGRRSTMPVIKLLSTLFIEFWRGVPLITVLFMASVMFPLFIPPEASIDQLLRALIGVSLFSAAYMAEVIRGGLQAISKGQYEGAMALGLSYWKMMGLVVMPQALKIVIPGIVNTFIGLFKDTTLVLIIGLMDFLNTVQSSMSDPKWHAHSVPYTAYIFVAVVFWICCYSMARYSHYLEEKLHTGHKRDI